MSQVLAVISSALELLKLASETTRRFGRRPNLLGLGTYNTRERNNISIEYTDGAFVLKGEAETVPGPLTRQFVFRFPTVQATVGWVQVHLQRFYLFRVQLQQPFRFIEGREVVVLLFVGVLHLVSNQIRIVQVTSSNVTNAHLHTAQSVFARRWRGRAARRMIRNRALWRGIGEQVELLPPMGPFLGGRRYQEAKARFNAAAAYL